MDGFDDLLAPSRQTLEQNPFEDPFAKRSNSPDPWASYVHDPSASVFASHDDTNDHAAFSGFGASTTTAFDDSHDAQHVFGGTTSPGFHAWDAQDTSSLVSPISISEQLEEQPKTPSVSSPQESVTRSPGFRESVTESIDEVVTPTKTTHDEPPLTIREDSPPPTLKHVPPPLAPPSPTSIESPVSPIPATAPAIVGHGHTPSLSRPSTSSVPSASQTGFSSPLEQPRTASVDRSFAGLSLGGETFGGWQGSQSAFVSSTSFEKKPASIDEEEDDDDDKPILQSANLDERTKAALSLASLSRLLSWSPLIMLLFVSAYEHTGAACSETH